MVKTGIKIFARLRPTKKGTAVYEVGEREDGLNSLSFTVPRSEGSGSVDNRREIYSFKFSRVFDCNASQEDVFIEVARDVISNCLEGYNGTIFAYGQTGSGKTFTITGGVERYNERGLIPRALSYLFQQYEKSPGTMFSTHISYLEIYNESGYDLLDPRHEATRLEDLPKVTLMEDRDSVIHLRNLSLHPATNEEEALNWLFLGDTNRIMAETPMNMASTRSHCIFTIHLSARQPGSDVIRRAKLHLVDLAGSERVGRTGAEGTLLTEAKYINLSLHYLEQVIVALSDKSRSHIPYRNSMMTSVLRDSLGGNCMTTMIAACSVEKRNIDETISTCRFSQRVALVKNEATLNEELDPKLMVQRLKQQVAELREELSIARGGEEGEGEIDSNDRERCGQLVEKYLQDDSPEARLLVGGDMRKIQLCFSLLKVRIQTLLTAAATPSNEPSGDAQLTSDPKIMRLEEAIRQRDDEINKLLRMLKTEQWRVAEMSAVRRGDHDRGGEGVRSEEEGEGQRGSHGEGEEDGGRRSRQSSEEHMQSQQSAARKAWKRELSQARQEAFDSFRKKCPLMSRVKQHKTALKTRYAEAKALGQKVNMSRNAINQLKAKLEKCHISRGLAGLTRGVASDAGLDERETGIKTEIEAEKTKFKSLYQTLRGMKSEIEHMQHLLDRSKVEVQQEFELWWQSQVGKTRAAWLTPPTSTSSQPHQHTRHISDAEHYVADSSGHHVGATDSLGHHLTATDTSVHMRNMALTYRTPQPLFPSRAMSPHTSIPPAPHSTKPSPPAPHSTNPPTILPLAPHSTKPSPLAPHSTNPPTILPPAPHSTNPPTISPPAPHSTNPLTISPPVPHSTNPPTISPLAPHATKPSSPAPNSINSSPVAPLTIPLTGDRRADADILAFYKARQKLIDRGNQMM